VRVQRLESGSVVYGELPRGCQLCQQGLKTVIFLTGLCPQRCFYCPLSYERKGRDIVFVNERLTPLEQLEREAVLEILRTGAKGASVTGGEPLLKPRVVVELVRRLKDVFSRDFHVHLYTSGTLLNEKIVEELGDAGLDELRLHAPLGSLERVLSIVRSHGGGMRVGLEYPALPGREGDLIALLDAAERFEVDFLILNELEFTETNASSLLLRGYSMLPDYRAARGSRETALLVLEEAERRSAPFSVHFCPVSVKDGVQTPLRVYRHANLNALPHQLVSDEGTVLEVEYTRLEKQGLLADLYPRGRLPLFLQELAAEGAILERSLALGGLVLEEVPLKRGSVAVGGVIYTGK